MPPSSTISSKGQITVPAEIRHRLGLKEGDRVEFVLDNDLTVLRPARPSANPFQQFIGALLISPIVYAELLAYPNATQEFVNHFLNQTSIRIDFQLAPSVWQESGRRFARYANRRPKSSAKSLPKSSQESPKRLLADFLIGAHALLQADRFMTLDPKRYKLDFPDLRLHALHLN